VDIVFHRLVQRDLRAALAYYDEAGGSKLGDRFFADVEALVQKIQENPRRYHFFSAQFRRAPLSSFPYHFLYEERGGQVRVLVLRHDSRHPRFGLDRR
jgi:plasmid stabilization system protein ParE